MAKDWAAELSDASQIAVKLWQAVIKNYEVFSVLGRQLQKADPSCRAEILAYTFADKSTSTKRSRGISLIQYIRWSEGSHCPAFPFSESRIRVLRFLQKARRASHAPLSIQGSPSLR